MFLKIFLCFCTLRFYSVWGQGKCTDSRGTLISHGMHYVPGPDTCTLCVCDNGLPKVCKAVLCSPPQDCRSFRVGNTCCDFICLDDVVNPVEGTEANVRVAAGGAATVVLLTVALIVYRVKKQKRRRPTHADDQRSLTSIGYISGSMGYMGGTCETALGGWKPSSNYLPRGEAPPPYDEAVQCRDSVRLNNEGSYHRTYPASVDAMSRADDMQCGHGYVNIPRPITQLANTQNCYNAPLLQPAHPVHPVHPVHPAHQAHPTHPADARDASSLAHHTLAPNGVGVGVVGFPSAIRLTGSLGAISSRALLSVARDHDHMPAFYTNSAALPSDMHRTIPRLSGGGSGEGDVGELFGRGERALHAEVRRSFHKPGEGKRHVHRADTGRSVPRNLHVAHRPAHPAHPAHSAHQVHPGDDANIRTSADGRARAHEEQPIDEKPPPPPQPQPQLQPQPPADSAPHSTLPLTVDKPSCVCSYEQSGAPGSEETDDYRNECENCKSASSSRWVVEEGWGGVGEEGEGTQTLQRRAPPPAPPPVATATLPQPVTKQSRTLMGPPSNWENWFNTIPDSDTESEEE